MRLHFRCVKITLEEKQTTTYDKEPTYEQTVNVQFECIEANKAHGVCFFHGYIGLTLPVKEFKDSGYAIGQVYELTPT